MADRTGRPTSTEARLKWPLRLTFAGLFAERALRAAWPVVSIVLFVLAALMLGLQDSLPIEIAWFGAVAGVVAFVWTAILAVRRFRLPTMREARDRLDATLPGRPLAALEDHQAIGAGDAASERVWAAHVARMAERAKDARAVEPDLRLASRDPYALRYVALLAFVTALLFGSFWRVASVSELAPGGGQALASGPAWEGWIEPPAYTGKPSLYLNDIDQAALAVPAGSEITLRLYGEVGALSVAETVSDSPAEAPAKEEPQQTFAAIRDGRLAIDGPGGRGWDITVIPDTAPTVRTTEPIERTAGGEFNQPFAAEDDYGVVAGRAEMTLDLPRVDRRYGLAADPEPRDTIVLDLPLTISGDRANFEETLTDDLSQHPWAGLPATLTLSVEDAAGQTGRSEAQAIEIPARRFFDPLAKAIIEQRRDLLWTRQNAPRIAGVLRAVSNHPDDVFKSETAYLKLRVAIRRLEDGFRHGAVSDELQAETAAVLWDIALMIEEGDLNDALERLRRAQEKLADAIENGATDQEIADLMQELREAMQDYMRQLAENADPSQMEELSQNQDMQEMTSDQLEQMLQELQRLMEEGKTAEAMALLEQLRQMMENMQIARGQQGQGQSPGQQAMEGLAETLRQQQGLSDEAFRDLQDQFGQQGQQQGQEGQQGQGEQFGQGQPGQQGQGRMGEGQGDMPGQGALADRQQALRDELRRQQQNLPGAGTPEGDAARDALDRAGRAMEGAEDALRNEDFAGALDDQSEAIEALREGMRKLNEQLAQEEGQPGGQGEATGERDANTRRDPLGREVGQNGRLGTDEQVLQGEDVYRRARELLDEIRKRSADQSRPDAELDYLKRLLDRF
jgi:uncharacterized protein (TIGR02302 family)